MAENVAVVPAEIKPVSGKVALESGTKAPTSREGRALRKAADNASLITVDVAAGGEIPSGMKDNLLIAYFGEKDIAKIKDPVLKPLAKGLNDIINQVENNLNGTATTEVDASIITTIRSTEGWKNAFDDLPVAEQKQLIKRLRETWAVSAGRRLYTEKMVIAQEVGGYEAAKRKHEEAARQTKERTDERDTIDKQIKGKDRAKIVADKDARVSSLDGLKGMRQTLSGRRDALENKSDELTSTYRQVNPKTGAVTFNKVGRDNDPDYKKYQSEIKKIDNEINGVGTVQGLDAQIIAAQLEVNKADKLVQSFDRHDSLTTEIGTLNQQLTNAEADLITARTSLANKINELTKSLNGVLPEAAKEAMNKYKDSIDNANIKIAKDKAEEAAKAGDIIKGAEANVEMYYLQAKYIQEQQRTSSKLVDLFMRNKGIKETNKVLLRKDLTEILKNDGRGSADLLKHDVDTAIAVGHGAGLSPEQIKYFKENPKAYADFIEQAKVSVFKAVSRQAVLHINLTETDMQTLIGSPDFATAADQALGDAQKLKDLKAKLGEAGLKGGTWKEIGSKLAKPALLGLLLMVLIFLGVKGFGG